LIDFIPAKLAFTTCTEHSANMAAMAVFKEPTINYSSSSLSNFNVQGVRQITVR